MSSFSLGTKLSFPDASSRLRREDPWEITVGGFRSFGLRLRKLNAC